MKVPQEIYSEFQHLKDRVINLDKLIELEKQEPIPFFKEAKEAKEALWTKLRYLAENLKGAPCSATETWTQKVRRILGETQYRHLKTEVCAEVANKMFLKEEKGKHWLISIEDGEYKTAWNWDNDSSFGEIWFNNRQAAEAFLKLMQTPLFEGDVTI
jgi:hypothetical protein